MSDPLSLDTQIRGALNAIGSRLTGLQEQFRSTGGVTPPLLGTRKLLSVATERARRMGFFPEIVLDCPDDPIPNWYLDHESSADEHAPWRLSATLSRICKRLMFTFPFAFSEVQKKRGADAVAAWQHTGSTQEFVDLRTQVIERLARFANTDESSTPLVLGWELDARLAQLLRAGNVLEYLSSAFDILSGSINDLQILEDVVTPHVLKEEIRIWLSMGT